MLRAPVHVRPADVDDVAPLAPLWDEFRQLSLGAVAAASPAEIGERVRQRIVASSAVVEAGGRPTYRLAVARLDDAAVGFASFTVVDHGLLADTGSVLVDAVHVSCDRRKVGIGTALLREAVVFADEVGAVDVTVSVPPSSREMNRFYARYGFAPQVLRRSAPVSVLRRKLGVDLRLDATGELTPVQRTLRRRALLSPRRTPARP